MSFVFDAHQGLAIVKVEVVGPSGSAILQFALDTGATKTTINAGPLVALGYDPSLSPNRVQVTTGSGVEYAARVELLKIRALGQDRAAFSVICHTLPPSTGVDGLLGLDFLRGRILTVDFQKGEIVLT